MPRPDQLEVLEFLGPIYSFRTYAIVLSCRCMYGQGAGIGITFPTCYKTWIALHGRSFLDFIVDTAIDGISGAVTLSTHLVMIL